jgi:Mrp family chromosome partitioning ATPase
MATSPEPSPESAASAAQRGFRPLFLLYRLHVDSQHPSAPLRAGSGAQRKTNRSGIAESLNTVSVLAGEGGVGRTWVALALAAKPRESDDYCGPESDDDLEP